MYGLRDRQIEADSYIWIWEKTMSPSMMWNPNLFYESLYVVPLLEEGGSQICAYLCVYLL